MKSGVRKGTWNSQHLHRNSQEIYKLSRLGWVFTQILINDLILSDWHNGLIMKLPKKGDLRNYYNWRGIAISTKQDNLQKFDEHN